MKNVFQVFLIASLFLISCQKEEEQLSYESHDDNVLKFAEQIGVDLDKIGISKKYVFVSDMIYDRERLAEYTEQYSKQTNARSYSFSNNNDVTQHQNIVINMPTNIGITQNWRNAIIRAVNLYNNLNLDLTFSVTSNNLTNNNNQDNVVEVVPFDFSIPLINGTNATQGAAAIPPLNGYVGQYIWLNTNPSEPTTNHNALALHEIGHVIGFGHTYSGTDIPDDHHHHHVSWFCNGVSQSNESIMHPAPIRTTFSYCDRSAIRSVY